MKKLIMVISLMMAFSIIVAPEVMADIISQGDYVELTAYNSIGGGGIMTYAVSHNGGTNVAFSYDTFCIQENVYVTPGVWYPVANVSNTVGFFNAIPPPDGAGTLKGAVDYLFYMYKSGAYTSFGLNEQADFQKLLWELQLGLSPTSTGTPWASDLTNYNNSSGLQHPWGTMVINIVSGKDSNGYTGPDIQNQLYNQVPEPSTIFLLGSGLIVLGLSGFRKKFKK